MDSKTRVRTALNHEEPDRVPFDYWAAPEVTERLVRELGLEDADALLRHFGTDLRYVEGPSFAGRERAVHEDGSTEDLWGVRRAVKDVENRGFKWSYKHVVESPLAAAETANDIEAYEQWPSPDWWDYSSVAAQCAAFDGYAIVNKGDRLDRTAQLKPMIYLRGMEQVMIDLLTNEALVDAIIERVTQYYLDYNERVFAAMQGTCDIFMMGDDFGTQHGPMMNIETWRRFFRTGFRAYIEQAHRFGLKVMHHTCGSVQYLMKEFIDAGLDILQSVQPGAHDMDLAALKREYGRDISFHGSVDIQETLPLGTPDDVEREVKTRMDAAKAGGGFIISTSHNIQPDTPTENIVALFEAYRRYGAY